MQVDPIKPVLKAPGSMLLKLRCDGPLSSVAFNFNLRRYTLTSIVKHFAWQGNIGIGLPGRVAKADGESVNETSDDEETMLALERQQAAGRG